MKKLKNFLMIILAPTLLTLPVKGEGAARETFTVFSFFKSENPFQDALNTSNLTTPAMTVFYEKMNNQPVWFEKGQLTSVGKIAIDVLKTADQEGLNPKDYEDVVHLIEVPKPLVEENWVNAELLLTRRFLEFIDHVRIGRMDPMKISSDIKFHSPKTHAIELLIDALQDKKTEGNKLRLMAPNIPQYQDLKGILADYRHQGERPIQEPKLTLSTPLKFGDSDPEVVTLRQILISHGCLDSALDKGEKFDKNVRAALKEFQKRYSLDMDATVGTRTREMLNYPLKEWIQKVIVNMERLRWLPDDLGHKHIIVNVAGYVLQGFEDSQVTLMMPIIVGRPDRKTPLFYATLRNVVFNPSWGVPHSIFINDKLPKIRNDPAYVRRANFIITDRHGKVIDPDAADWLNEGKNYYLRQSPGLNNALGQIKFNIENPYIIYLHGTPDQHLFTKRARAFSSGCIRLKYPLKLAAWVLNHDSQWSCDTIQAVINSGETKTVKPDEYVPVYFTYQTIWMKENKKGKRIFYSNDPYKLDAKMIKVLKVNSREY